MFSILINVLLEAEQTIGHSPQLAFAAMAVVVAWTAYLTKGHVPSRGRVLFVDVVICGGLLLVSGFVMPRGSVSTGYTLLAVTYPFCSVLSAATAYGPLLGAAVGFVMGICHVLARGWARSLDGIQIDQDLLAQRWPTATGYALMGLFFGIVANLLRRSSEEAHQATAEAFSAREREARLAERESMAREIHDSVLQVLALIHKRGLQLAESGSPSPQQVMELAEMARDQEVALRGLILREPDEGPRGEASLRTALEAAARSVRDIDVSVSTVGPVWLPGTVLGEIVAAVREALANIVKHAKAAKVTIFADQHDGVVQVSVRDDGVGFEFDEARFRADGKFGVLNSMRGRIEGLGGQMKIDTRPGAGTEIEFLVPVEAGAGS